MAEHDVEAAKRLAMQMLSRRARSEAEVRARLARSGFSEGDVDAAIARLRELRFLDDAAFARNRAEKLLVAGRLGPKGVARKLIGQGISSEQADQAIHEAQGDSKEIELAERFLKKLKPPVDRASPMEARARAARSLLSRGFSEEIVRQILGLQDGHSAE